MTADTKERRYAEGAETMAEAGRFIRRTIQEDQPMLILEHAIVSSATRFIADTAAALEAIEEEHGPDPSGPNWCDVCKDTPHPCPTLQLARYGVPKG